MKNFVFLQKSQVLKRLRVLFGSDFKKGIVVICAGLLFFAGCGEVKESETELVQIREQHREEIAELAQKQETELREQFEKGYQAGFIERLDEQSQNLFLRGKKEGLAEGMKEVRKLEQQEAAKAQEHKSELKALQQRIDNLLEERTDLMTKLRAAIERIDLYDLETKDDKY